MLIVANATVNKLHNALALKCGMLTTVHALVSLVFAPKERLGTNKVAIVNVAIKKTVLVRRFGTMIVVNVIVNKLHNALVLKCGMQTTVHALVSLVFALKEKFGTNKVVIVNVVIKKSVLVHKFGTLIVANAIVKKNSCVIALKYGNNKYANVPVIKL